MDAFQFAVTLRADPPRVLYLVEIGANLAAAVASFEAKSEGKITMDGTDYLYDIASVQRVGETI